MQEKGEGVIYGTDWGNGKDIVIKKSKYQEMVSVGYSIYLQASANTSEKQKYVKGLINACILIDICVYRLK